MSGIYFIINFENGKYYVGSASNLNRRWCEHQRKLNAGNHPNKHLQHAWNIYGEIAFQFAIVESVKDENQLLEIEQKWINASNCCNDELGYNINPTAGSQLGYKHSKETKHKISEGNKGNVISQEHKNAVSKAHKDKKLSKEVKAKMSKSKIGNQSSRKSNKWPCPDGWKCKCENCREKYREYWRNRSENKSKRHIFRSLDRIIST